MQLFVFFQRFTQAVVAGEADDVAALHFEAHQVFAVGRALAFAVARMGSHGVDKAFVVAGHGFKVVEFALEAFDDAGIERFVFDKMAVGVDADDAESVVGFVFGNHNAPVGKLLGGGRLVHAVKHIDAHGAQFGQIVLLRRSKRGHGFDADKGRQRSQQPPAEHGVG